MPKLRLKIKKKFLMPMLEIENEKKNFLMPMLGLKIKKLFCYANVGIEN